MPFQFPAIRPYIYPSYPSYPFDASHHTFTPTVISQSQLTAPQMAPLWTGGRCQTNRTGQVQTWQKSPENKIKT